MGVWTLLMLLFIFELPVNYAAAQANTILDARKISTTLHSAPVEANANTLHTVVSSPAFNPRHFTMPKAGYLPFNHKGTQWSTLSLRYNNSSAGDDWLNEHNMVMVKSIIQLANRLIVGINCHYNWCFTIAGNGAGMMLNKLPIKIYFAAVAGGAPDLGHR